jgi:membrane-associated phospholipid phosphatase
MLTYGCGLFFPILMKNFDQQIFRLASVILILGFLPIAILNKGDVVLYAQNMHSTGLDRLFVFITKLGEGWIFVPVIILVSAFQYKYAFNGVAVAVLHALLCVVMKQLLFNGMPRPNAYFEGQVELKEIAGITLHNHHAFPSGHTATAFALAFFLIMIIQKKWTLIFIPIAVLIGFSRIYIGQHFYSDVVAGAMVGSLSVFIVFKLNEVIEWPSWSYSGWAKVRKFATSSES